jgi:MFS transporter, DHA1 family, tetracycline resistance protein
MRKRTLLSIFLVFFLDNITFAVVFPLFSSLILTKQFNLVPITESLSNRTLLLGMLNASFPLALFIGAPIIGSFSDHFGRRRTFLATISATTLGNLATGFAIYWQNYPFLICSRLFSGFFSANLALCLAAISDISHDARTRAKNFGGLIAVMGISWTIAVLIGGDLSLRALNPDFSPALPFWIVTGLGALNFIFLYFLFPETYPPAPYRIPIFEQIALAMKRNGLHLLYLAQFFCNFSWMFIFQWFSAYSLEWYHLPRDVTGISLSIMGLCWILGGTLVNELVIHHFSLKKIPLYSLLLLTILFLLSSFFSNYFILVALDCLKALIVSLTIANLLNFVSLAASETIQGRVMGFSQSVTTLAFFTSALTGSFTPVNEVPLFYQIAALTSAMGFFVYLLQQRKVNGT